VALAIQRMRPHDAAELARWASAPQIQAAARLRRAVERMAPAQVRELAEWVRAPHRAIPAGTVRAFNGLIHDRSVERGREQESKTQALAHRTAPLTRLELQITGPRQIRFLPFLQRSSAIPMFRKVSSVRARYELRRSRPSLDGISRQTRAGREHPQPST